MQLTQEQLAARDSRGHRTTIDALAGTGKSTLMQAIAEGYPQRARLLYVVFAKRDQMSAKERMPNNTLSRTAHALAFRDVGKDYANAEQIVGSIRPIEAADAAGGKRFAAATRYRFGRNVFETVQAFCRSADDEMGRQHLPVEMLDPAKATPVDNMFAPGDILGGAARLWSRMADLDDAEVGMTHDGYFKIWALQRPRLPFDVILQDETQDTNPVVEDVVNRQEHARLVRVGDPNQAIYSWRGAINAMDAPCDERFQLTGTFRFPQRVAEYGNDILEFLDPGGAQLQGLAPENRRSPGNATEAFIARTNAGLFKEAIERADNMRNPRLHWVGGIESYGVDVLEAVHALRQGQKSGHAFIDSFPNFETLKEYGEQSEDPEIVQRVSLVEEYDDSLPRKLEQVRNATVGHERRAGQIMTTAHRSKGGQWPRVRLADDFTDIMDDTRDDGTPVPLEARMDAAENPTALAEEYKLRYVVATRAEQYIEVDNDHGRFHALRKKMGGRVDATVENAKTDRQGERRERREDEPATVPGM